MRDPKQISDDLAKLDAELATNSEERAKLLATQRALAAERDTARQPAKAKEEEE